MAKTICPQFPFKRTILKFIRPNPTSIFKVNKYQGLILLTRLRIGFSHLREHKFRHGFLDIIDPTCRTNVIETTEHYLLQCSNYSNHRITLFVDLRKLNVSFIPFNTSTLCRILIFGNPTFTNDINREILNTIIKFIISI